MITPKLEQLIWEGRAFFKTFVAGGSQRHNLNIQQDRFIIITDITYFSSGHFEDSASGTNNTWANMQRQGMNTQLTILGERGVNRFLFRNSFVGVPHNNTGNVEHLLPVGHTAINTYLLHTTQVAFSFSLAQDLIGQTVAVTPGEFFAIQPPTDYGRDGQPGALNVTTVAQVNSVPAYDDLFAAAATANTDESKEFSFPVNGTTNIVDINRVNSWAYPILHVNYVEVIGSPNNLSI
jgi:hypothetical protein